MTDNEIIKALRLCADRGCYRCTEYGKEYCRYTVASLAWDLIYRQKAEVERLKVDLEFKCDDCKYIKLSQEEYRTAILKAKSEAIREFVMSFKKRISFFIPIATVEEKQGVYKCLDKVDEVKKEMVGDAPI